MFEFGRRFILVEFIFSVLQSGNRLSPSAAILTHLFHRPTSPFHSLISQIQYRCRVLTYSCSVVISTYNYFSEITRLSVDCFDFTLSFT